MLATAGNIGLAYARSAYPHIGKPAPNLSRESQDGPVRWYNEPLPRGVRQSTCSSRRLKRLLQKRRRAFDRHARVTFHLHIRFTPQICPPQSDSHPPTRLGPPQSARPARRNPFCIYITHCFADKFLTLCIAQIMLDFCACHPKMGTDAATHKYPPRPECFPFVLPSAVNPSIRARRIKFQERKHDSADP